MKDEKIWMVIKTHSNTHTHNEHTDRAANGTAILEEFRVYGCFERVGVEVL